MELQRIIAAEMRPDLRLRLVFADGGEGIADLTRLAALGGALSILATNPSAFSVVQNGRAIAWRDADGDEVDLCADALRDMLVDARHAAE
jgi:hypothetical protein